MRINKIIVGTCVALVLTLDLAVGSLHVSAFAQSAQTAGTVNVAVGPQYDTTHVYVPAADFDRFVASVLQTFGGKTGQDGVLTVTPTPSTTRIQLVLTPVGTLSVFGFKTPVPYPFTLERTGYLVTDMDEAIEIPQWNVDMCRVILRADSHARRSDSLRTLGECTEVLGLARETNCQNYRD